MRPDAIKLLCHLLDCCFDPEALVALDGKVYERLDDYDVDETSRGTGKPTWQLRWRVILDFDDYDYIADAETYSKLEAAWNQA